jgi:hypothetical protein
MQTIAKIQGSASELSPAAPDFLSGYISEEEYARRRGVTVRTCQRDRQLRKSPPYIQFGRRVFYRVEAMRAWLLNREKVEDLAPVAPRTPVRRAPQNWAGGRS